MYWRIKKKDCFICQKQKRFEFADLFRTETNSMLWKPQLAVGLGVFHTGISTDIRIMWLPL